jgi:outer membrane PBP1 activator LpoA protein
LKQLRIKCMDTNPGRNFEAQNNPAFEVPEPEIPTRAEMEVANQVLAERQKARAELVSQGAKMKEQSQAKAEQLMGELKQELSPETQARLEKVQAELAARDPDAEVTNLTLPEYDGEDLDETDEAVITEEDTEETPTIYKRNAA